jgi:hypothetical protein
MDALLRGISIKVIIPAFQAGEVGAVPTCRSLGKLVFIKLYTPVVQRTERETSNFDVARSNRARGATK